LSCSQVTSQVVKKIANRHDKARRKRDEMLRLMQQYNSRMASKSKHTLFYKDGKEQKNR